jgi:hypothetical protein
MTDQTAAREALAEMARRRVESRQLGLRRDIALRLLAEHGSVSVEQVNAQFEAEWTEPGSQHLADQVAAKCAAAVEVERREAEAAREAVAKLRDKVGKFEDLLEAVREQVAVAEAGVAAADLRVREAQALLECATAAGGDPGEAPPPTGVQAAAESAEARAEGGV